MARYLDSTASWATIVWRRAADGGVRCGPPRRSPRACAAQRATSAYLAPANGSPYWRRYAFSASTFIARNRSPSGSVHVFPQRAGKGEGRQRAWCSDGWCAWIGLCIVAVISWLLFNLGELQHVTSGRHERASGLQPRLSSVCHTHTVQPTSVHCLAVCISYQGRTVPDRCLKGGGAYGKAVLRPKRQHALGRPAPPPAHSTDMSITGGTHFAFVCQSGLLHAGRPKEGAHKWCVLIF